MTSFLSLRGLAAIAAIAPLGAEAQPHETVAGITWEQVSQPLLLWLGSLALLLIVFVLIGWWRIRGKQDTASRNSRGLVWVAFTLLIALGVPMWDVLHRQPPPPSDLEITCTGSQWKWHFDYTRYQGKALDGLTFFSAMRTPAGQDADTLAQQLFSNTPATVNADDLLEVDQPMVLPAGGKVRFSITSEDSVHAWWIPGLHIKKDAIPGFMQTVDVQLPPQPGVFHGMCSQLCGQDHAFMPIVVKLVPPAEFDAWMEDVRATLAARAQRPVPETLDATLLLRQGESLYRDRCALCHLASGAGATARVPSLANNPLIQGEPEPLASLLHEGRNAMPGMRGILARDELAALTSYVRSRWGQLPEQETIVQPSHLPEAF